MQTITLRNGLDIPVAGEPAQQLRQAAQVSEVALIGEDYIGLTPTMLVQEGDQVQLGQPLFTDKKNQGFFFTAPGSGVVKAINRGAKRRFLSLVIGLQGDQAVVFEQARQPIPELQPETIRRLLHDSGLWTSFRTRPFGRIPAADSLPASLFITAMDTNPLAADPLVVIEHNPHQFSTGLAVLRRLLQVPIHLCSRPQPRLPELEGIQPWGFLGPHPAGLPSTHIHFIDPVHSGHQVWHICYQDVIAIGHLFTSGSLSTERVIAVGGPGAQNPGLLVTRPGASLTELCREELHQQGQWRLLSGSPLDGRMLTKETGYLGRYHRQVSVIGEGAGRALFGWLAPGGDRFSCTRLFASALKKNNHFSFLTAVWGGSRAIYPLGTYEKVIPMDIIATSLLKSLAVGDAEKSADLGALELIEEDLALCSFVCPGKNEFGPMLRSVLNAIEQGA